MIHSKAFLEFRLGTRYKLRGDEWKAGYLGSYGPAAPDHWPEAEAEDYRAGMSARLEDDDLEEEKMRW